MKLSKSLLIATALVSAPSTAYAQSTPNEVEALRAEVQLLKDQLAAISAKVDASDAAQKAKAAADAKKPAPAQSQVETKWKGAPETIGEGGWSFKPRGRIHYDVGSVSAPGALQNRNLGFASRIRRVRLGMEGTMPGDLGYKVDVDFANANISFGDVWLTYTPKNAPVVVRIGNFETLNSMEQISSSNNVTFMERNAFNDAFINARRLGAAVAVHGKNNELFAEVGLFTGHTIDSSLDNDGWIGAARAYYAPKVGKAQLHLGANFQYRDFSTNNAGTPSASLASPSTNQLARYRARPNSQLTDVRFVDTGSFAAKGDSILGFEAAAIFPQFYISGEAQWLKTRGYKSGDTATGLDTFSGGNAAVVPTDNPGFFGAFAEVGAFLTGETRGYNNKAGTWARPKVLKPLSKGGLGAFQVAARLDYLDLDTKELKAGLTNNFNTGAATLAALDSRLGRGGKQVGYLVGLNWYPIDYARFMLNYAHVNVTGGPLAAAVLPASTGFVDTRKYGVDVISARMQFEF